MKKFIKQYGAIPAGLLYGMMPVVFAWLFIHSLGALAALVCGAVGLEEALTMQISQALQQLQQAKIVMPWLAGLLLGLLSSVLLLVTKGRKGRVALIVVGVLLLLPLTLGAFCLARINSVQVWRELVALARWL